MTLIRNESREGLPKSRDMFDRFFDDFSEAFHHPVLLWPTWDREPIRVDEYRENGTLVVKLDLPGIDPDKDVEISVSDSVLHIVAERREEKEAEGRDYVRRELYYGSFRRDIALPKSASDEDLKATYKDGILEVRVPIAEVPTASTKKIAITKA